MSFHGKILLADDEPHIRKFLSLLVLRIGATSVLEAANGQQAVEIYERERPELVLLDVNMPVMDGIETLRRLMEIDPDCVVVMMTSLINRQTVDQALELGASGYVRKDTPPEEIVSALKDVVAECFGDEDPAPAEGGSQETAE